MALVSNTFQVNTTPVLIATGVGKITRVTVLPISGSLYLGDSAVTPSTGLPLRQVENVPQYYELKAGDELYIVATDIGNYDVRVIVN